MIRCPQCDRPMNQVAARANPGSLIQLDQCGRCGGIWCDKWELFPVQPDEAARLELVDEKLLSTLTELGEKTLYCPRCTSKLEIFKDAVLPKDILLRRCSRCEGIWLNRGQLSRYKNHQKRIRLEKMGAEASVHKLPEVYQNPKSWVVTGTQGIFAYPQGAADEEEIFGIDLIHGGELGHVAQEHRRLDYLFERRAGGFQNGFQIFQDLSRLSGDSSLDQVARLGIEGNLSRRVDKTIGLDCLRIRPDGFGSFVALHCFSTHAQGLL